ncbi:restriction endonuclease [Streptomyces sp. NBC_01352]|uniref:NaeI family type II restriction endonuclease n=1 Tax=Streptomyces sp. NBC_01352 TaxID=2903834 RepID=UPI002E367CCB|nr:NaeI family type II restriction endonuclease [Streptomyces sp. NBC_01352]
MEDALFSRDVAAANNIARPTGPLEEDPNLQEVINWFTKQPELERRFGQSIRQSIDEVLDGQRTGRFNIDELEKTEKTYLGTKVEIILRAEFRLGRGRDMDYSIATHEVDSKFTIGENWTIPGEADQHICLLARASDHKANYRAGLLRIHSEFLNAGKNRDGKRTLSTAGRSAVRWIIPDGKLPENILLTLSSEERAAIFNASAGHRSSGNGGQSRTNELFRRVQERLINRNTVLTVARQDDSPKRVRDARIHLRGDGIMILGHMKQHPHIARDLGLPVPDKGSWVAVRVAEVTASDSARRTTRISGKDYAIWQKGDRDDVAPAEY